MVSNSICLGISFLGKCAYDPAAPASLQFSIGEGISAIALIFVVYQLIDDIASARIYIRKIPSYIAYAFFIVALVSVFLAAVLPFIPGEAIPLLGYPIFWEFTAGA